MRASSEGASGDQVKVVMDSAALIEGNCSYLVSGNNCIRRGTADDNGVDGGFQA